MKCDFCSNEIQHGWEYPCHNFTVTVLAINPDTGRQKEIKWESTSSWMACEKCSMLIDLKAWRALAEETASQDLLVQPRILLYENFQMFRIGEKVKV